MEEKLPAPLVSVVIPCYNQAHFLPEAIESVLGQSYSRVEVVIVDDGSPDHARDVTSRYPVVRYVRQNNEGLASARNTGFHHSQGEYVLFLDADDRLTPNAIESHLACFSERPESGFVVGDIDHMALNGSYAGAPRWPLLESDQYQELLRVRHVANTIAVMFRREVLERLGGFNPACSPAEDYELLLRAARLFPSRHHRNVVARYRRHPDTLSRKGTLMLPAMNRVMRLQREQVKADPVLLAAWRQGDAYWKDHFGAAAVKELLGYLRRGQLSGAARAVITLVRFVGPRIFALPWKRRHRLLQLFRRSVGVRGKSAAIRPMTPAATGSRREDPSLSKG